MLVAVGEHNARAQETREATELQAGDDPALPQPETRPLAIDFANDPVLTLGDAEAAPETFRRIVVSALEQSPVDRKAAALERSAAARLGEARVFASQLDAD